MNVGDIPNFAYTGAAQTAATITPNPVDVGQTILISVVIQ